MLSVLTTVVYATLVPAGLVLGTTTERVALLAVTAVLLLRLLARHRSAARLATVSALEALPAQLAAPVEPHPGAEPSAA